MIKVSVIMPCFNVAETLIRALDSIIMQEVNFEYEVLVVDDASTDQTVALAKQYALQYPQVKVICNEKNKGNAYTYYTGLCASKGDYFCVLDGDDYYTIPDKLQRQVDFLDSDTEEEYVGTATQFIIDLGNNMVSIPDRSTYQEFTYADFLSQNSGYYHTATYMYRNIFRGNVPPQMGEVLYRGDTPRTMFHLSYSGKKIKILDFVGSAYTFEFNGIWSGLKQKQQFEYQISYQLRHKENVSTDFEQVSADRIIEQNQNKMKMAQDDLRRYPSITINQALKYISEYASAFAFRQKDFVLQHAYYSSYIDTLCASLGTIDLIRNPEYIQKDQSGQICIVNGELNPHGGGIFREIEELADIYQNKQVFLIVTMMEEIPEQVEDLLAVHPNLTVLCPPADCTERLRWFREQFIRIAPYRTYYYCSHKDAYGAALVQKGCCENISLFSFDHGYLCGITNPNLDRIIAKRPADYWMLHKKLKEKVIFIPTWSDGARDCEGRLYQAFCDHRTLVTASGAARFYKVDGRPPYRYIDMVISLLRNTGGRHYHFGELPDQIQTEIKEKLSAAGAAPDQFVHIPWSDNIPLTLLRNHVDLFIEPFPVVSYKLTLEVLSVGVPVAARQGFSRMHIADFLPPDSLLWRNKEEFISALSSLTSEYLMEQSEKAKIYFQTHHSVEVISRLIQENTGLPEPEKKPYTDNTLIDITSSLRLFGNNFQISIMDKAKKEKCKKEMEKQREGQQKRNECRVRQEQLDAEIRNFRSGKAFKLGYILTLPIRSCKHLLCYSIKYGPVQGITKLKKDKIIFYHLENKKDELYALKNSIAYKLGFMLTIPYRRVKYGPQYDTILRMEKYLEQQGKMIKQYGEIQKEQIAQAVKGLLQSQNYLEQTIIQNHIKDVLRIQNIEDQTKNIEKTLYAIPEKINGTSTIINRRSEEICDRIRSSNQMILRASSKMIHRSIIEHLDYHLTEHCNLNCIGCSTFAPIADRAFADLDSFEQDMKKLHKLAGDMVQQIHLLGGEPLLHPQAEQFARVCRSIFTKARIDITTNGLLVFDMTETFWKVLRENDIAIKYTRYPINFDYSKMTEYIKNKGIFAFSAGGETAIKYFRRIPLNPKGTFNIYNSFIQCPYTDCAQLRDGKLYHCPASAFSDLLNRKIKETNPSAEKFHISEGDCLNLDQIRTGSEIFEFVSRPVPFCQHCDMDHINEHIDWGVSRRNINEWVDRE